jgi:hypothetical protein
VIRKNANNKNGEGQIKTTMVGGEMVSKGHTVSVSFLFLFFSYFIYLLLAMKHFRF